MSERARVLLVDDNEDMLERAAAVLGPDYDIVAAVKDGPSALAAAKTLEPDVIVLDISMPGMSGLEVAGRLKNAGSTAVVVFLTIYEDEELVNAAREAGGLGFVVKPKLRTDLSKAVLLARSGERFVSALRINRGSKA